MTGTQIFALTTNGLALILTLGMIQWLALRRGWRTATGRALLQFLVSLAVQQSAHLLMVVSVLADYPPLIVEGIANLRIMSSFWVALAGLALLLYAGNAMKAAWQVASRSGVTGMITLLPGFWYFDLLQFPASLSDTVLNYPYTTFGSVVAVLCAAYLILTLGAAWRFGRQIAAPPLIMAVLSVAVAQCAEMMFAPLRDLGLAGAVGGIASTVAVYFFMVQWEIDPQTSQTSWFTTARQIADILTLNQPLQTALTQLSEQIRSLVRCDAIVAFVCIGTERLEIVAAASGDPTANSVLAAMRGRQIQQGEGLAGRVMQTLYPMRVDNYHTWNGRSPNFEDIPLYASMSVPLLFDGCLVGVINAGQTSPGRTFTDRDQRLLELLAPQMAIMIVTNQQNDELQAIQAQLHAVVAHTPAALLIFDTAGMLQWTNPLAQRYLHEWFGKRQPSAAEFMAKAEDTLLTEAWTHWTTDSTWAQTLETNYLSLGRVHIELQPLVTAHSDQTDLLILFRPMSDLSPE